MNVYLGFIAALVAVQLITVGAAPASIIKITKNHYDLTSASSSPSSSSSQPSSPSPQPPPPPSPPSSLLSSLLPSQQPHRHPYRHHRHSRHIKISDFESPQWMNPCEHDVSATEYISSTEYAPHNYTIKNRKIALEQMMAILPSLVDDVDLMHAIDTSHISDWFGHNSSYSFLRRVNVSQDKILLKTWHRNVQVYVGAFQNLWLKQVKAESSHSPIAQELYNLTVKSKKLLCEIEATINSTGPVMKTIFTAEQMKEILKFRNNDTNSVDDIDTKFTKVRFFEYLKNVRSQTRAGINRLKLKLRSGLRRKSGGRSSKAGISKSDTQVSNHHSGRKAGGNRKANNSKNKNNKNDKPLESAHKKRNKNNDRHNKKRVHHKNNNKNKQNTKLTKNHNHKNEILSIPPQ